MHAPTGSGKSACWLLPIINDIQEKKTKERTATGRTLKDSPYAIVIAPTKEICENLHAYASSLAVSKCSSLGVVGRGITEHHSLMHLIHFRHKSRRGAFLRRHADGELDAVDCPRLRYL